MVVNKFFGNRTARALPSTVLGAATPSSFWQWLLALLGLFDDKKVFARIAEVAGDAGKDDFQRFAREAKKRGVGFSILDVTPR